MVIKHGLNHDGTKADQAKIDRYIGYSKHPKSVPSATVTKSTASTSAPTFHGGSPARYATPDRPDSPIADPEVLASLEPTTKEPVMKPRKRKRKLQSEVTGPDTRPVSATVTAEATVTATGETDIGPTAAKVKARLTAKHSALKLSDAACVRKPSRPEKVCRKVRDETASVLAIPRRPSVPVPAGRLRRITPAKMAKMVHRRSRQSTDTVTTDIADRYQINATQRKEISNRVIAMRAMHRRICQRIRNLLPVHQTLDTVASFLNTLAVELEELPSSDSAEEFIA